MNLYNLLIAKALSGGGGSDPSQGATATAADITLGKTAAANGTMLTGTNDYVKPTKGVILSDWDEDGYPTKLEPVGFTEIPVRYCSRDSNNRIALMLSKLSSVIINEGVIKINSYAFQAQHITSISLPTTLKQMDTEAFAGLITDKFHIPNVEAITFGAYALRGIKADELEIDGDVTLWNYAVIREFKRIVLHGSIPAIGATDSVGSAEVTELFDFSDQQSIPTLSAANQLAHKAGCVIRIPAALSDTTLGEGNGWESATNWVDLTGIVWEVV